MSFSEKLLSSVRSISICADLRNPRVLIDNLVFVHQLIVASEQLIKAAILRLHASSPHGFDLDLLRYYRAHLEEERDHAEWLATDLKAVDVDPISQKLNLAAAELAGVQYYLAHHAHPAALLGYMAVLECSPMPLDVVEELEALHGTALLKTLRYHATHDVDHGADVQRMLDRIPDELQNLVLQNAMMTASKLSSAAARFGKD